jgi:hypothetical protein
MLKDTVKKNDVYFRAYMNVLENWLNNPDQEYKPVFKKLIVYGVKYINTIRNTQYNTREDVANRFEFADITRAMMANLTPREFMNLFPVTKEYNGHRWGTKDYFYTMESIKKLNLDEPIGENINDFLWDYMNHEIDVFLVNLLCFASDLRRFDTGKGILEEFCEQNGIPTYTLHKNNTGKEYFINNQTGKTMKVRKAKPRYLKIIKGGSSY